MPRLFFRNRAPNEDGFSARIAVEPRIARIAESDPFTRLIGVGLGEDADQQPRVAFPDPGVVPEEPSEPIIELGTPGGVEALPREPSLRRGVDGNLKGTVNGISDGEPRDVDGANRRHDRDRFEEEPAEQFINTTEIVTRSIDGIGNNAMYADWGAAHQQLLRLAPVTFEDGIGEMVSDRPNAREISNAIAAQDGEEPNSFGFSDMLWAWGQFIDHDLDLTEAGETEPAPIFAPADDPVFAEGGVIAFNRVDPVEGAGEGDTPRAYQNEITSVIDAGVLYGSDAETAALVRSGPYIRLDDNGLLPATDDGGVIAGDVRAAENIALTSLHTLFAREHNRWVDLLAAAVPDLTDDELFDAARMRVEAEMQAITFTEFLPILVGEGAIDPYQGYDETVNPGISVEFSTAAYRFGHSLLSPDLLRLNEDGSSIEAGTISLQDAFFNPTAIAENGGIDPILRGLAASAAQELDTQVVEDVRSFLFAPTGEVGLDLAAINIQRGRDLGVASYNDLREAFGLERAGTFSDITSDVEIAARLEELYGDVDLVDAWVGGLAEDPANGGLLGETFAAVIVDQFTRIRDGDAMWSQTGQFAEDELDALWSTSLADIIEANTEIGSIQDDAFLAYERIGGTDQDDGLAGTEGRDLLLGGPGDDRLDGGEGDDQLEGGDGQDTLIGGAGDDLLYGGAASDTFLFTGSSGHDVIVDFDASDTVEIARNDSLHLDTMLERAGDDVILTLDEETSITWLDVEPHQVQDQFTFV